MKIVIFIVFICLLPLNMPMIALAQEVDTAIHNEESFGLWLNDLRKDPALQGISMATINDAFSTMELLDTVIELDRKQPENKITLEEYVEKAVTAARIRNGRMELEENRELLEKVARKYSVPAKVIVALWGMETSYGENSGNFNVISSLATLAYEGRRSAFFRDELIKALRIMDMEKIPADAFEGSWAGAFGQCQFMPTSFLKYAVDFDGDGKRDIWFSEADIFASIAHYLSSEGWIMGDRIEEGSNNFKVLLKWNRSRYFATAVGKLSQAIGE
jgi:membrane-bound lytic murein transglycosylase B